MNQDLRRRRVGQHVRSRVVRRQPRLWMAWLVRSVMVVAMSWLLICIIAFGGSPSGQPTKADAFFVLATTHEALPKAMELMATDPSSVLVVSTPEFVGIPAPDICTAPTDYEVICLRPVPQTTQGEAIAIASLARNRNWGTINVLTFSTHIKRSRSLIARCWDGNLHMVAFAREMSLADYLRQFVYESGAMAKAAITPDCASELPGSIPDFLDSWKWDS